MISPGVSDTLVRISAKHVKIMKPFLFLILVICFTFPVFTQEKSREIDLRLNGIGSGTPYLTVVRKLGKPMRIEKERFAADSSCSGKAEAHLTLFYSGLKITLIGDGSGRNPDVILSKLQRKSG